MNCETSPGHRSVVCVALAALALVAAAPVLAQDERLAARLEQLTMDPAADVRSATIAAVDALNAFYGERDLELAWTDPARRREVLAEVRASSTIGLDPEDYHERVLAMLLAEAEASPGDAQLAADLDILLSDALALLVYHRYVGKLDPTVLDPDWNFARALPEDVGVRLLAAAAAAPSIGAFVADYLPERGPVYEALKRALAEHRAIAARGGWPVVSEGATLHPGDRDPRVASLRARLAVTDGAIASVPDDALYDADLESAVRRFQRRHALGADGVVGKATLAALNVPVEARIDQLRVNLERVRWVFGDLDREFLLVNIAGFEVLLFREGRVIWEARAQVGTPYRKTPVFKARMTYFVLNPDWTVPPTILRRDVLPRLREAPLEYLAANDMALLDAEGNVVDAAGVDWPALASGPFPYQVRRQPGPNNPLGRVKFMFPNPHFVFLHDTPSRTLFDKPVRTFSSGCIRLERPFELLELLLAERTEWTRARVDDVLASGRTTTVALGEPLTVMVLYATAQPDLATGEIQFFDDVYGRDGAVLAALEDGLARTVPVAPRPREAIEDALPAGGAPDAIPAGR